MNAIDRLNALMSTQRPLIMGVVNVTPDSFFDGGEHGDTRVAIDHALRLIDEGADIIDVGGESTRPPGRDYGDGAIRVESSDEIGRVVPVIRGITTLRPGVVVSVDTMKPGVAAHGVDAGAAMVNDVSAGRFDCAMWETVARLNVPYVVMHGYDPGDLRSIDEHVYDDIVAEVFVFLADRIAGARQCGIASVIADVGLGFSKGVHHNVKLLHRYARFADLGVPTLVGASRKSFIGRILEGEPPQHRLEGSLAAAGHAVQHGARIVRVHDVLSTRRYLNVMRTLTTGRIDV